MKISLNWLKKLVEVPVTDEELVRLIGARLVEVEEVVDETHKYDNIYIVRVEKAEKIPGTHLTLCQINAGKAGQALSRAGGSAKIEVDENGLIQVLCGAPNVREGMLAVWIAPGATVPASVHEDAPFVIGKRKMLGKYISNGMLAGADELDFSDNHETIAEIEPGMAEPGEALADVFELNDLVLDIENKSLTHRPDCFGMIGFAREVAGILGQQFENREGRQGDMAKRQKQIAISISEPAICPRYTAVVLEKHGEMKGKYLTWMDTILSKSGMRPVDPVVDVTNYLMLLTGQPLHAFDYDKFVAVGGKKEPKIGVRLAREGEKLILLDDKEITLNCNDIVICSHDVPVALAGAMGGKSTEIDKNTRNLIIESATFSLYNLRKTQMAHGIFTEAITRFTKGQPPYQTARVAEMCAEMLSEGYRPVAMGDECSVKPEKIVVDQRSSVGRRFEKENKFSFSSSPLTVKITTDEINGLLGTDYSEDLIAKTLTNVNFEVKSKGKELAVTVPEWRTDIHIKEDVVEEVGRLLGYDNIQPVVPLHATAHENELFELKNQIRKLLARLGANEVLTYSFVAGRLLEKAGLDPANSYKIVNSISPELQYVRQSIVPSLLDKAYMNEKLPVERFAIFELNKVYQKDWGMNEEGVPVEQNALGLVIAERKNKRTAFYAAKKYAQAVLDALNIEAEFRPLKSKQAVAQPFEPQRAAGIMVGDEQIGVVGELKNSVRSEFKLAPYVAGVELNVDQLMKMRVQSDKIVPVGRKYEDVTVATEQTYAQALKEIEVKYPGAKISPGAIYQAPGQKTKNITFRINKKV